MSLPGIISGITETDSTKAVLHNNLKQVYTLLSRNQSFNSFNDFVPMAVSINSDFLQFFVSHFNQHIKCYLEWEIDHFLYNSINRTTQLPMTAETYSTTAEAKSE